MCGLGRQQGCDARSGNMEGKVFPVVMRPKDGCGKGMRRWFWGVGGSISPFHWPAPTCFTINFKMPLINVLHIDFKIPLINICIARDYLGE